MKTLIVVLGLLFFTGCATEPLTPEQAAQYRAAGAAMMGMGAQMQQMNQQRSKPTICRIHSNGLVWCY